MGEYTGKSYQPSNGTEGSWFEDKFCMRCVSCDPDPSGPKQCAILCAALAFSIGEEHYPKEWVYDENDKPMCTAWKEWDWAKKGNPDDPQNEHYVQSEDPAQLKLFCEEIKQGDGIVEMHKETIQCPECNHIQEAIVEHTIPWNTYVHTCTMCKYIIMESEWKVVNETKYGNH